MKIITQKSYQNLRDRMQDLDYSGFNRSLMEITGRSSFTIQRIVKGERSFHREEMDLILEAIGEPATDENYLKYFPTLGLPVPEAKQLAKEFIVSALRAFA